MSGTMDQGKAGPAHQATVHEVQGVFPDDATMQDALSQLTLAGYDRADFSLPEEQPAGELATPNESADPATDDADKRQLRTLGTSMAGYAGAVAVAGATLATGGAAGIAVAAAAAVGAGTAAAANTAGQAADAAQVEERNRRGREGRLILAVRTTTPEQVSQVIDLMQKTGATKTNSVERADQALTAGVTSASWTGA
jgi:hypothetical protein